MATKENTFDSGPKIQPSPVELGVTYKGAVLEGSVHILSANEITKMSLHEGNLRFVRDGDKEEMHIDDFDANRFIEIRPGRRSGHGGLICDFRVKALEPINLFAHVQFQTDRGSTGTHFALEIREGEPPGGKLLFCDSPFAAYSGRAAHDNLRLTLRELAIQVNASERLPRDLSLFHCLVLHGAGLRPLVEPERESVRRYLESGRRVVILANHFFHDTIMWANHLTEPYGIHLEDREYYEVLCDREHVEDHRLTEEVKRLRWFRPSPMTISGPARLLVRNPDRLDEGFVACGGPSQNLVVVGESLLSSLLCQGWPFDNGQLFANIVKASG
jgi:hypothetical protein